MAGGRLVSIHWVDREERQEFPPRCIHHLPQPAHRHFADCCDRGSDRDGATSFHRATRATTECRGHGEGATVSISTSRQHSDTMNAWSRSRAQRNRGWVRAQNRRRSVLTRNSVLSDDAMVFLGTCLRLMYDMVAYRLFRTRDIVARCHESDGTQNDRHPTLA